MNTFTSPEEVNALVASLAPYRSEFTGQEYDTAVRVALTLQDYIDAHVQIPFIVFTGDYEEQDITHLVRGTWLHAIHTSVEIPFSKSTPMYEYGIYYTHQDEEHLLLQIPTQIMMDPDIEVTYPMDFEIPPDSRVFMRTNSTNAYGRFRVKFIMA